MRGAVMCSVVLVCAGVALVSGCADGSSETAEAPRTVVDDWRTIDLCAVISQQQLADLVDDPSDLTPSRRDDETSISCRFKARTTVSAATFSLFDTSDQIAPFGPVHSLRTMAIGGRAADVKYEFSGTCRLTVHFGDLHLGLEILPAGAKTAVDFGDTSAESCDAQLPLIESVVSKINLP